MKKNYITKSEMDYIAESELINAGISTDWQGKIQKIDIDALIEFEYDLDIEWEDIDHLAKDGVILAAIYPKSKKIFMNSTKSEFLTEKMGTMNFTKAHELGHWVLHVIKQQDYQQLSFVEEDHFFCRCGTNRPPEEFQADMFAASLLMPKNIITNAVNELKEKGFVTFRELYEMKDEFEVSISALTKRITKLGLLYIKDRKVFLSKAEANGQMTLI